MPETLYRIVFRGQVLPGRRLEEVRQRATRRLHLSPEQAEVMFSGRKIYLKRNVGTEAAKAYVKELLYVGLHVRIEREGEDRPPPPPREQSRAAAAEFDPTNTEQYTPTQIDNALAGFVTDYTSTNLFAPSGNDEEVRDLPPPAAPAAPAIRHQQVAPRPAAASTALPQTPTAPARVRPHRSASSALTELVVPDIPEPAIDKPDRKQRPPRSLAEEYASQRKAERKERRKELRKTDRQITVLIVIGIVALIGLWAFMR